MPSTCPQTLILSGLLSDPTSPSSDTEAVKGLHACDKVTTGPYEG